MAQKRSGANRRVTQLQVENLEPRCLLAAEPIINEILASNSGVIQDQDGDFSDFIEIYNRGDEAVNLGGWYLTDNAGDLTKWQFPSTSLPAGQYLVVFASSKNRAIAGSQLHTNFALSADGEYLGLVRPDLTVASEFNPAFPQQYEDVSYGIATGISGTTLLGPGDSAHVLIPTNGILGTTWTQTGFLPSGSWQTGDLGVGYDSTPGPPPSTTVLAIDFNDRENAGATQAGFSSFIIGSTGGINAIQMGSITRTFGSYSVTISDTSGLGFDDRRRDTPVNAGAFSDSALLRDFVFSREQTGTGGFDVTIEGLAANNIYTLTVWSFDSGSTGLRTSDWTANGVVAASNYSFNGSALPTSNDTYKFEVVVAADAMGKIVLSGRNDEDADALSVFLNALRIETGDALNATPPLSDILRVDFNSRTGGESALGNTEPGYATMSLDENNVTINGRVVSVLAYNGSQLDDRDRSNPVEGGAFSLDQVYDDFIFSAGAAGTGMEVLVSGLAPNVAYDVVLRSFDADAVGPRQSTWTEVSSGGSVVLASPYTFDGSMTPTNNDQNAIRATVVSSAQGTLKFRGVQNGANRSVVLNSLELTRATLDELIDFDVQAAMQGVNSSAYVRAPFSVANAALVDRLLLDIQYDSGFVAYINGQEVARRNAPTGVGVAPAFNASATHERTVMEAAAIETIDLTAFTHLLNIGGSNVLAIHGLNSAAANADFLVVPTLRGETLGGENLRYFDTPTPGTVNSSGFVDFVSPVEASHEHGFYDTPFVLALQTNTAGASIYYTFDGTVPTASNPSATLYTAPFQIDTTSILRTAAYKADYSDSVVVTQTYIFLDDVLTQNPQSNSLGLVYPSIWQANYPADYTMDSRIVSQWDDNNPGNTDFGIREGLLSIPTMSIVLPHNDLWHPSTGIYVDATKEGDAWRRAGSIEYFDPNTGEEFQYNVGIQMHGAASRDNVRTPKHSFRLIFNPEWDGPGRLEFPLFDGSDFADINTVVLRASFTDSFSTRTQQNRYSPVDSTYTRDVWMRDTQLAMGHLAPDSTYVHLYINGVYWGLYSPAERTDDAFLAAHIGGEREDWDIIRDFNELYRGSKSVWNQMFEIVDQLPSASSSQANAIYQQLQGKNADGTVNPALPVYLDMDNLIDYIVLHLYAGVEDWPSHNWVAARNRVDPGLGFQFFTWDQEIALDSFFRDRTENVNLSNTDTPGELYFKLRNSSEFRLRFADRVHKHLFNDGALAVDANIDRWLARADQIEAAIIAESARWGDAREDGPNNYGPGYPTVVPLMTVDLWRDSVQDVVDGFPTNHSLAISRFTADGLYNSIGPPQFSQFGGIVLDGYDLSMTTTTVGGVIWYTTDGTDPRLLGGAVNMATASQYSSPVDISQTVTVKARTRTAGGQWSPLTEATFAVSSGKIIISEINYHPADPTAAESALVPGVQKDDFEFIEIVNTHPTNHVNLQNMSLANGLTFTFGNESLAPGEYAVVVENIAAFQARYGTSARILGTWNGGLSNSGEIIELRDATNEIIMALNFADVDPWNEAPDNDGATLVMIDPFGTPVEKLAKWYSWRASTEYNGSPGEANAAPIGVVVNEVLSNPSGTDVDAIELHNTTNQAINIGGWYLSDAGGTPLKYQIPAGTILAAGGYIVFDETQFLFGLKGAEDDDVFLVIPDGNGGVASFVDSVHFGASYNGVSFGRVPDGSGRLAPMSSQSFGYENGYPRVRPLVITEVNYQPGSPSPAALAIEPTLTSAQLEFIEIYNSSLATIDLTDGGIAGNSTFAFPAGTSIAAGQTLVVVSFDPTLPGNANRASAFRAHYGIGLGVALIGPFSGALDNLGSRIELQLPGDVGLPDRLVDEVLYDNLAPWPTNVQGTGNSMHRSAPTAYGNEAIVWHGATPSPGAVNFPLPGDFNGDGQLTLVDLDLLTAAIGSGSSNDFYDLVNDNILNAADVSALINLVNPIPGDYDWDSDVDSADYGNWKSGFGSNLHLNNDGNRDGVVNAADYVIWRDRLGASSGSSTMASAEASTAAAPLPPSEAAEALEEPVAKTQSADSAFGLLSESANQPTNRPVRGASFLGSVPQFTPRSPASRLLLEQLFAPSDEPYENDRLEWTTESEVEQQEEDSTSETLELAFAQLGYL